MEFVKGLAIVDKVSQLFRIEGFEMVIEFGCSKGSK